MQRSAKKTAQRTTQARRTRNEGPVDVEWADSTTITNAEAKRLAGDTRTCDCICTICTCGTHKCPPDTVMGRYHNLKTSYMDSFKGDMVPVERVTRKQFVHQTRPFEGISTTQADYKWNGLPEPRSLAVAARMDNGIGATNLPFEGTTTHKSDFQRWNAPPARSARGPQARAVAMPDNRSFETEFRGQFTQKPVSVRMSKAPTERRSQTLPFEGTTTHQTDFQQWDSKPPKSFYRQSGYRRRPEDRDFSTEVRGEYTPKEFDVCPAKAVAVSTKPGNGHVEVLPFGQGYVLA